MVDNLKPEDRKKTMQAVKGKGTRLEKQLFSTLAGLGIRGWKKNVKDVKGKPDVVFPQEKVVIFIDGCFWHGCPICHRSLPESNKDYWERKIKRNVELAKIYNKVLADEGWTVVRIWEHEMKDKATMQKIKQTLKKALNGVN